MALTKPFVLLLFTIKQRRRLLFFNRCFAVLSPSIFCFQETIVSILFQSQVVKKVEKIRFEFLPQNPVFTALCIWDILWVWRNVAHLSQIPWVQWRLNGWFVYVLRTLCIFYIKSPKVSGAELELVHGMNRDMYVSDGGYKRGQRNEKHTLFISTQPCMTLLINMPLCLFTPLEQLWQFHIFQSCLFSAVTSS